MLSPPMLSMYSLLLRAGFRHKIGKPYTNTIEKLIEGEVKPYQREDAEQLEESKSGIDRIIKYGYARIFYNDPKKNYPGNVEIYNMHENAGIVSFTSGNSKRIQTYWHRKLSAAKKKKEDVV